MEAKLIMKTINRENILKNDNSSEKFTVKVKETE